MLAGRTAVLPQRGSVSMPALPSSRAALPAALTAQTLRTDGAANSLRRADLVIQAQALPAQQGAAAKRGDLQRTAVVAAPPAPVQPTVASTEAKKTTEGPIIMNGQILHNIGKERLELVNSMAPYVTAKVLPILKDTTTCWQPADYLPKPESDTFLDEVRELRERTAVLPDDYWVVLVGDMITEEALPTYMAMLNTLDGVRDETGAAQTPWGIWTRAWTAEENRHGDLMNKYAYLSGRVDMRAVEQTIQNLIGSGMDPKTDNDPYNGFIYTSFQERATAVSHSATSRHARALGDPVLADICMAIANDERRHELAYTRIVDELWNLDPSGTMVAFYDMMKKTIVMPAHLMEDGKHAPRNLFKDFSEVAEYTGTYTASDYLDILEHLMKKWKVGSRTGLTPEAQQAQESLMALPPRFRKIEERRAAKKVRGPREHIQFSWLFNRAVAV